MNTRKLITGLLSFLFVGLMVMPLQAQKDQKKSYEEIEKRQDDIEQMYMQIYGIIEEYPEATYDYMYDDGEVTAVVVENVPNANDKRQLELYLMDLEDMKKDIFNMTNRVGVYYVAETEPVPKDGYKSFYENLRGLVTYPEQAEDLGVEGTVYVKFVVNDKGDIANVIAAEDIKTDTEWVVESMVAEAKRAVEATSGDWIPAKIAGIPVSHWVVIPVQFKVDSPYYRPLFGAVND